MVSVVVEVAVAHCVDYGLAHLCAASLTPIERYRRAVYGGSVSDALASLGVKQTTVHIITSPTLTRNSHEVMVAGAFGRLTTVTENVPSPTNPKTSYLAILAAEALLKKVFSRIKIGT